MDRQEERDHKYEVFVLEQAKRYADMNAKCAKVYVVLAVACIAMGVVGIFLGKSVLKGIVIMAWSIGFYAARKYYEEVADSTWSCAEKIEAAIEDPDFDIPDQYDDDVLALRDLVTPTLKNVRSQVIAYSVIAVSLWAATILLAALFGFGGTDYSPILLISSFIMGGMGFVITVLAIRSIRDLPVAKAYDRYLYEDLSEEDEAAEE